MIVSGETSGDLHAARLIRAISETANREVAAFGAAGPRLREAGVEPVVYSDSLSVVGLPEIARALPMFVRAFRDLKKAAVEQRPDVAILVDFPDFNLKLAKALKRANIKVVYYISPQLWAWRQYRIRTIRKYVDLLITILPFEKPWYAERGIDRVEYVGSPLAKQVHPERSKGEFCERHAIDPDKIIVSLLPGSRHKEISRIFPLMLDAAALLAERTSGIQFVVPATSAATARQVLAIMSERSGLISAKFVVTENETYDALHASDAAAVTSGTATLETGIIGTPMAVVYKTSKFNYKLLRPLITVKHFGLINLIAEERIARELIQDDLTPAALADELGRLLQPDVNTAFRQELKLVSLKLGHGGASARAARAVLNLIDQA